MWAVAAGAALGFAYTLSPLTIIACLVFWPACRIAVRPLGPAERRWLLTVVLIAVALRVLAIGGLFLTADPNIPYANFFGDEEFFKRKTTWLRNVAMGIPISTADFIYAFDKTGDNSYVLMLTYVQALVGLAPYGIHILNASMYVAAALIVYRLARPAFGGPAALAGLTLLLFMPSLFFWSISALKEPVYFLVAAINILMCVSIARGRRWWVKVMAAAGLVLGALALQSLREGGLILATVGAVGGLSLAWLVRRPRWLIAAALILPLVAGAAATRPAVQERALSVFRDAAMKHWGHINTPGQSYRLMDAEFYIDRKSVAEMTPRDAGRYVIGAFWSYATVPLPWQVESRSALAYVPEHVLWIVLLLLTPIGAIAALRVDAVLGSLLIMHGGAAAAMVALSGGNVGTLVRHRGLAMPYFAWLAGLGLVVVAARIFATSEQPPADGSPAFQPSRTGYAWPS